jgi:tripartite-type tricarboxylate transporter receptor subunit TctC
MRTIYSYFLCSALSLATTAYANDVSTYPDKPIRIVVPFAPGGASDVMTRKIADKLSPRLKQSLIIDNRAGGNTMIASDHVAKAPKDGYTIYSTNTAILQMPMLYSTARYDEEKDFTPVVQYCNAPLVLVVRAENPSKNVKEFIDYIKARPGQTTYGTAGAGGTQHLLSETLRRAVGIDSVHVPYKGEAPLMTDFLGGRIDWYIATPITVSPHVKSGKVRTLAVTGEDRVLLFPDTPTFKEAGISKLNVVGWYGLFAPANTPKPIIDKLSKEVAAVLKQPDLIAYMQENGLVPTASESDAFAKKLPYFRQTFRSMIKENDIKIE